MRYRVWAALAALGMTLFLAACGDDDEGEATPADPTTTESAEPPATTAAPGDDTSPPDGADGDGAAAPTLGAIDPTYEFAVQQPYGFSPTAGALGGGEEGEIVVIAHAGETMRLEFIELDPEGPACPTDPELIEVTDAAGGLVATGSGTEIEMPSTAVDGPLTMTVLCERDGEPGIGVYAPIVLADLLDVTVTPAAILTGESATVELAGGCPDGFEGRAGLTPFAPAGAEFAVLGETPALGADGTAVLTVPEGATGTFQATIQCADEETMAVAVGWAELEVGAG